MSGFFTDADGEAHWGLHGAAGLLIRHHSEEDGRVRYLLQRRGRGSHHGGTWSIPGGAIDRKPDGALESPEEAAAREADEELGPLPGGLQHVATLRRDYGAPAGQPGSWSYWTVMADSPAMFRPDDRRTFEHGGAGWFTPAEMAALPLHPAFIATAVSLGMPR